MRLTRGASTSLLVRTPSRATGRIAAAASANQITPRTACTAPTNVTARTRSSYVVRRLRQRRIESSATATIASSQKSVVVAPGLLHCHSRRMGANGASTSIRS